MIHSTIIGVLGADCKTKTKDGVGQWSLNVAVRISEEETQWVTVYGTGIVPGGAYLKKGAKIAVSGELRANLYTDGQGVQRIGLRIFAEGRPEIVMFAKKESEEGGTDGEA